MAVNSITAFYRLRFHAGRQFKGGRRLRGGQASTQMRIRIHGPATHQQKRRKILTPPLPNFFSSSDIDGVCKGVAILLSAASKTMRQLLSELQIRHEGKGSGSLLSAASKTMRQLLSELQIRHEGKL